MLVTNLRPYEVEIPDIGLVAAGDAIEVPDEVGASLCLQVDAWKLAKPVTPTKVVKATEEQK